MTQLKPVDQKSPSWQRTTLLATDSSHSIIVEIVDGRTNAIAYSAYGQQSGQQEVITHLGLNCVRCKPVGICWVMAIVPTTRD